LRFRNLFTLLLISLLVSSHAFARSEPEESGMHFAHFIEVITDNIENLKAGRICIIGSDEISKFFRRRPLTIDIKAKIKKFAICNTIYVSQDQHKDFYRRIDEFTNKRIFTIAAFDNFVENGGMMEIRLGRKSFELIVNSESLKRADLKLNTSISSLTQNTSKDNKKLP